MVKRTWSSIQPVCDRSHKPTVITFCQARCNLPGRPLTGAKLYCLVTEARGCEQLAQSRYAATPRPGVEPATIESQFPRPPLCHHHTPSVQTLKWNEIEVDFNHVQSLDT